MARPRGRGLEQQKVREAEQKAAARSAASRRRSFVYVAVGLVIVGGVVAWIITRPPPPGVLYPNLGNFHLGSIDQPHAPYNSSPPSSGPHFGGVADWREHADPVPPELFVHNLEDGGVVIAYDCPTGCDELLGDMRSVLDDFSGENVLMTPYTGIVDDAGVPHPGAAVAWTRVFYFDDLNAEDTVAELGDFIELFEGVDHHVR